MSAITLEIVDINKNFIITPSTQTTASKYRLVGRSTRDYFTNKTITDPTNSVAATKLTAGGGTLDLPSAAPSGSRQIIVYNSSALEWKNIVKSTDMSNVLYVSKLGSNSIGSREGSPFLTISAALSNAQSGDTVIIMPGTYNESITIPAGVSIRGVDQEKCIISLTGQTGATTLITMGNTTELSNVSLVLGSAQHVNLTGISFPGATTTSSLVQNVNLSVDNSGAGAGTSTVTGVNVEAGGNPADTKYNVEAANITVSSTGSGTKSGLSAAASAKINVTKSNIHCIGGSTSIGILATGASALVNIRQTTSSGSTTDVSSTTGQIISDVFHRKQRFTLNYASTGPFVLATNTESRDRFIMFSVLTQETFAAVTGIIFLFSTVNNALAATLIDSSATGPNTTLPRRQSIPPFNSTALPEFGLIIWPAGEDLQILFEQDPTGATGYIDVVWIYIN